MSNEEGNQRTTTTMTMTPAPDRISELPDCILTKILSLLPVGESARTSALSPRWRSLWLQSAVSLSDRSLIQNRSAPFLNPIDADTYNDIFNDREETSWCYNVFSRIISLHPGPIVSCTFSYFLWNRVPVSDLHRLIEILTHKGIEHLHLGFGNPNSDFPLPDFLLECDSLQSLSLRGCGFPIQLPDRSFVNLKGLKLQRTSIEMPQLRYLLANCLLAELEINHCYTLQHIIIKSDCLVSLRIVERRESYVKHITIESAPNLRMLLFDVETTNNYCKLDIHHAPKLEVLGNVNTRISKLRIGDFDLEARRLLQQSSGLNTRMHSLRALTIRVDFNQVYPTKMIPHLLKCFPRLEKLNILIYDNWERPHYGPCGDYLRRQFDIECLENCLKSVQLRGYSGEQNEVEFARFILSNAKALKAMTLICRDVREKEWIEIRRQSLRLSKKASDARVVLRKNEHFKDKDVDWESMYF